MIKILSVSESINKKLENVFNDDEFSSVSDSDLVLDILDTASFDVIIVDSKFKNIKNILKKIKSKLENTILILNVSGDNFNTDLVKFTNAFITPDMSKDLISATVSANLRMRNAKEMLSNSNKDLADTLYRQRVMYETSSLFAGTLDKNKLIQYMSDGIDRTLSYSLECILSLCNNEPVLILNSIYELSDELISAIKLRTVLNFNSLLS